MSSRRLALLLFLAYLVKGSGLPIAADIAVIIVILAGLIRPDFQHQSGYWGLILLHMVVELAMGWFEVPNHHFVLTYLLIAVTLCAACEDAEFASLMRTNARWLLVGIMGFATLHKALSPTFMSGEYVGCMLARGSFLEVVAPLFPDFASITDANVEHIRDLLATSPNIDPSASVTLTAPVPYFRAVTMAFVWLIVLGELWLAVVVAAFGSRPIATWSLWCFVVGLSLIRMEFMFVATITFLAYCLCEDRQTRLRPLLLASSIGYLALHLIVDY
jgi:hypothetical protein